MSQPKQDLPITNIAFIEGQLTEELLLRAEALYDKGPILQSKAINHDTWESIVEDQNIHYRNTLRIKKDNLVRYSCNCVHGRQQNLCAHIVVTIFHIRRQSQNPTTLPPQKSTKKRLSLHALIEGIEPEYLQGFTLEYAQKNRAFKLLLIARFLDKLPEEDVDGFVESIYPTHRQLNQKVVASQLSIFIAVASELHEHIQALWLRQEYIRTYDLVRKVLVKSFYIKSHLSAPHEALSKIHNQLVGNYIECHRLVEAPEYKELMLGQLNQLLSLSFVDATDPIDQQLWMISYRHAAYFSDLRQSIQAYLNRPQDATRGRYFVTMLSLMVADGDTWHDSIAALNPQDAFQIIQLLISYSDLQVAKDLLKSFLLSRELNHSTAMRILESTELTIDEPLIQGLIAYYMRLKKTSYVAWIQKRAKNWPKIKGKIQKIIVNTQDTQMLLQWYIFNKEAAKAADTLMVDGSWSIITDVDQSLYAMDPDLCREVYSTYLNNYLNKHFGVMASQHFQEVLTRARRIAGAPWAKKLASEIQNHFPHRDW